MQHKSYGRLKQVWHWPYETPGIVDSGLYAITIVCGPKDMSLEKYFLISQKNINTIAVYMNFYIEQMDQSIHYNVAF